MKLLFKITDYDITEQSFKELPNYNLRKVARGIIIREDGKIAILYKSNKNEYKLVGGGIEDNEEPKDAFIREVLEETGCEIEITDELGKVEEYRNKKEFKQISYVYIGKVIKDTKKINYTEKEINEGAKLLWLEPNIALEYMNNCYNNLKASEYSDIYSTKFVVLRDKRILEYYIKHFAK